MIGRIIAGISGFILGAVIVLFVRIKNVRKKINADLQRFAVKGLTDFQRNKVKQIIVQKRKQYKKQNKGVVARSVLGLKKKKSSVFPKAYADVIKEVAVVFDDKRKNAFLDFSIKSGFDFLHKVIDRIESVLDATEIAVLKNLKISRLAGITSLTSKVLSNKAVNAGLGLSKKISNLINIINPYHWIKKIALSIFFTKIINEILLASVDIVAWEFARFYEQSQEKIELKTA
ncbi:MAG: hypothetical protein IJW64_00020 [Clostridia bacterium]|nr:hypothetical protein [Clostridia bacterium]